MHDGCVKCNGISRRDFVKIGALSYFGLSLTQLFEMEAAHAQTEPAKAKAVILLWMDGGPSHTDTFDPKPDGSSETRSEFAAIPTVVPGIQLCEHLPLMAKQVDKVTLVRSMTHHEGAHERAAHTMLTGWHPLPSLVYPSMGSVVAREMDNSGALPPYIAIPGAGFGSGYGQSGYLEASYNPFAVGGDPNNPNFSVRDVGLPPGMTMERVERRRTLLQNMDALYRRLDATPEARSQNTFYDRAYDMISSPQTKKAFNIQDEPANIRDLYGHTTFGQGCLLARRLVEAGVRFVTVEMGGWDTHAGNFPALKDHLLPPVDQGFSGLLQDLHDRGLLKDTLVVWMGEFGRAPKVNEKAGRDHWPGALTVVMAGAGVPGGQALGVTDADGASVKDHPVSPGDLVATIYSKLGIDYSKKYITPTMRPVRILGEGDPISELG